MENNNIAEVAATSPEQEILLSDVHSEAQVNKRNALIGIGIICLFVLLLAVAFLFAGSKKSETVSPVTAKQELQYTEPVADVPIMSDAPPSPFASGASPQLPDSYTISPPTNPLPVVNVPNPAFGVALISGTLAFDLNHDGVLTNADVAILSQALERGQYLSLFDFDSDGVLNVNDLALIRAPLSEYPVVCYDLNDDKAINMNDIAIVSQAIDRGQYVPLFDFDADGVIDMKDLATIRAAVSEDGSVGGINR